MAVGARHATYTLDEYLALEELSNVKHEYLDGEIHAMAGGTPEHGAIAARVIAALVERLRGSGCTTYSSDVRVRVAATGLLTYPDVSVVCGEPERDPVDPNALANPVLLVEVLSPSTAAYDRGEKLAHYRRIPSLREVVLVAHDEEAAELWRRSGETWDRERVEPGGEVELGSVGCRLPVAALYGD